jgi:hypothetical protein
MLTFRASHSENCLTFPQYPLDQLTDDYVWKASNPFQRLWNGLFGDSKNSFVILLFRSKFQEGIWCCYSSIIFFVVLFIWSEYLQNGGTCKFLDGQKHE